MLNKVRIALVMNEFGQWSAYGNWCETDADSVREARGTMIDSSSICTCAAYFVEVDVMPPKPETVPGILVASGDK